MKKRQEKGGGTEWVEDRLIQAIQFWSLPSLETSKKKQQEKTGPQIKGGYSALSQPEGLWNPWKEEAFQSKRSSGGQGAYRPLSMGLAKTPEND